MFSAGWIFLVYWCVAIFFHTKFILDKEGLHEVTTLFKCNRIKHYPIDKIRKFGVASKSGGNGSINIYVVCTGEDFNVSLHSDSAQEIEYLCRELNRFLKKVKNTGGTISSELNMVEINSLPRGNEKPLESRWDIENDGYGFSLLYQNKHTPWIFWTYCFSEIFVTTFFVFLIFVLLKDNEGPANIWVLNFFVFFFLFPLGYSIYKIPAYAIEELRKKTQVSKWRFSKDKLVYDKDGSGNENGIGKEISLENWKAIQLDQDTSSGSIFCSVVLLDKYNNEIAVIRQLTEMEAQWLVDVLLREYEVLRKEN